jgi:hypothetical protein
MLLLYQKVNEKRSKKGGFKPSTQNNYMPKSPEPGWKTGVKPGVKNVTSITSTILAPKKNVRCL